MPVAHHARGAFSQVAQNDNVPAGRRRLARAATAVMILVTSAALVLIHSVPAWWQPAWQPAGATRRPAVARLAALGPPAAVASVR